MMKQTTEMGFNRTGLATHPLESGEMTKAAALDVSGAAGGEGQHDEALEGIRSLKKFYLENADPIGTVPLPMSMKGAAKAGVQLLKGQDATLLIDKLGERLAFERTGVRLYDALIDKCRVQAPNADIQRLIVIRSEEAEHFKLIHSCLEQLGADPTAQTPGADTMGTASMGLIKVISDPRSTIEQSLQAIHAAELMDYDGWELLIKVARDADLDEMVKSFQEASEREMEHLDFVRKWHEELVSVKPQPAIQ